MSIIEAMLLFLTDIFSLLDDCNIITFQVLSAIYMPTRKKFFFIYFSFPGDLYNLTAGNPGVLPSLRKCVKCKVKYVPYFTKCKENHRFFFFLY